MKFRLIIIILLLIVGSCSFFRAPGKDNCEKIISSKKMTAILGDAYLLEAYLSKNMNRQEWLKDSAIYYYGGLFEKHGVSKSDFEQALNCYLLNEKEMALIHEEILSRLSLLQSKSERLLIQDRSVHDDGKNETAIGFGIEGNRHRWQVTIQRITPILSETLILIDPTTNGDTPATSDSLEQTIQ